VPSTIQPAASLGDLKQVKISGDRDGGSPQWTNRSSHRQLLTSGDTTMSFALRALMLSVVALTLSASSVHAQETKAAHEAVTPVPRPGGWMDRHEAMNARVAKGDVDLVFIGDSITQGWEGNGREVWKEFYGTRNAVNLGIGGDRTQHVMWRLDNGNLEGISPKLAVIMIGTNNSNSNKPDEIADGIEAIVKQLKTKTPETKILLLGIFPRGETPDHPQRQVNEQTNQIVSKLADSEQVHYLDISKAFLESDGRLSKEVMPDLLHLSEKGYRIWAEAIETKVAELMGESSGRQR
jgi:lysophospholipase L1-like esterase